MGLWGSGGIGDIGGVSGPRGIWGVWGTWGIGVERGNSEPQAGVDIGPIEVSSERLRNSHGLNSSRCFRLFLRDCPARKVGNVLPLNHANCWAANRHKGDRLLERGDGSPAQMYVRDAAPLAGCPPTRQEQRSHIPVRLRYRFPGPHPVAHCHVTS